MRTENQAQIRQPKWRNAKAEWNAGGVRGWAAGGFFFDSLRQDNAGQAAILDELNRKRAARTSGGCHLPWTGTGVPWAEAGGSAGNPELDGGRRAAGLEGPEIGRGNGNLKWNAVVAYAGRTNHDRKIFARDLGLGQIIADRAIRLIASPLTSGNHLWATGVMCAAGTECLLRAHPMMASTMGRIMGWKNRVQTGSDKR